MTFDDAPPEEIKKQAELLKKLCSTNPDSYIITTACRTGALQTALVLCCCRAALTSRCFWLRRMMPMSPATSDSSSRACRNLTNSSCSR